MKMYDLPDAYKDMQIAIPDIDAHINESIDLQKTVNSQAQNLSNTCTKEDTKQFPWKGILIAGSCAVVVIIIYNEIQKNKNYQSNRRQRILSYTRSADLKIDQ